MRPHLGDVERVEPVGLGVVVRHDLHRDVPRREVSGIDGVEEVATVVVGVGPRDELSLRALHLDVALVGGEVVLDPEALTGGVDPLVGVRAEAGHLAPGARQAAVAHQVGHLVRGLRGEGPEVPLHGRVAQAGARQALLRVDEVGELDAVADEEHRCVVADDVVVALGGVELHREAAHVAPGVGAALLTGNAGEALQRLGGRSGREDGGAGVRGDVSGHLEDAVRSAALGVHDALRDALAVELGELLDQVDVVQGSDSLGSNGQGVLVAGDGRSRLRGGGLDCHRAPSFDSGAGVESAVSVAVWQSGQRPQ